MSNMHRLGFFVGFLVTFAVLFVIMWKISSKSSGRREFDERQRSVQGIGYKYGFYTFITFIVLYIILDAAKVDLPVDRTFMYIVMLLVGVAVYVGYCIWHDGYFFIKQDIKKQSTIFLLLGVANLLISIVRIFEEGFLTDGKLNFNMSNLLIAVLMLYVYVLVRVKLKKDEREEQ